VTDETRRALCTWELGDQRSEGLAEISDEGVTVGPLSLSFQDTDQLRAADYRIELDQWPTGQLVLTQLGRRFDSFSAALRTARNQARVVGLLAHAPSMPEIFQGMHRGVPAEAHVYPTHVTVIPDSADPFQAPHGDAVEVTHVGRKTDAFAAAIASHRDAQARTLHGVAGQAGFADGIGVPRARIAGFPDLLARCAAPGRFAGAQTLLAAATGEPRLGFVRMLDPDDAGLAAAVPLPDEWASFVLVPVGPRVVLEILAGPGAATYVFEGDIESVNADLRSLHFRRAALALSSEQAQVTPANPHRLALRKLVPLQRLRAATRARLTHTDGWDNALAEALRSG
jgi:hypothetical protein